MFNLTAWETWWAGAQVALIEWMPKLLIALLVLLIGWLAARWADRAAHRVLDRVELPTTVERLIGRAVRLLVVIVALIGALMALGLQGLAASFLAGLGISGLLITFALQDIVKNFAAGLLLLFLRPFEIGDRVEIAGFDGVITDLQLRATRIRTRENDDVIVPNATVYTGTIINKSTYKVRREALTLTATAPLDEALQRLTDEVLKVKDVERQPPPQAIVTTIAHEPTVEVRYWIAVTRSGEAQIASQVARALRQLALERGWLKGTGDKPSGG